MIKLGYKVIIYNDDPRQYPDGKVEYRLISSQKHSYETDLFILYRTSHYMLKIVKAKDRWFWSTDQYTTNDWNEKIIPYISKFICISEYHRNYVANRYDIPNHILWVEPLGINERDYRVALPKERNKFIFCSVPHRGLGNLLPVWPDIKSKIPDANLYITSDYRLWGVPYLDNDIYLPMIDELNKSVGGIHPLWKIPREELVYHQLTSEMQTSPNIYDENFGISYMECMAAGCVPVTSKIGALETTCQDSCAIRLDGHPDDGVFMQQFVENVVRLSSDGGLRNKLAANGRNRALEQYSWPMISLDWQEKIDQALEI